MSKTIIIYYSYGTHTKMIAEEIQKELKCDLLEVKPVIPFSTDYDEVVAEYQNNECAKETPEIQKININLDDYDKIIIGTPVWWYTINPVIRTFLTKYDLSGKTVIPFATNAGWLGRSFKEIKSLCKNSKIENEKSILFTTDHTENKLVTSEKEIQEWINEIKNN